MEHSLNDILEKVYELEGLLLLARSREQDNIDASLRQLILAKGETIEALLGDTFAENEISVVEMPEPESDEASIEITSTTTIKAIAVKDGYVDSEVSEATYTKTSGVEQTYADKEVDRVEFYDLVGRRLKGLTPGNMTVVRILYKDGTARSMKLMKK